jgi:hypothetical protein
MKNAPIEIYPIVRLFYCIISTIVLTYDNNLNMNVLLVVLLRIEKEKNQVLYQLEPKKFVETERV